MNCGLCGSTVQEELASATVFNPLYPEAGEDEARTLQYALCPSCGLVFQTRLLTEEAYGRYYASHAPNAGSDENQKELFHQRFQVVNEILAGGGYQLHCRNRRRERRLFAYALRSKESCH